MRHIIFVMLFVGFAAPSTLAQDLPGWAAGLNASNSQQVSEIYATDAVILPPGAPATGRRDAIARYWDRQLGIGLSNVQIMSRETLAVGPDRIYETAMVTWHGADGVPLRQRSVILWELRSGEWRILRHTWNYGPQPFD